MVKHGECGANVHFPVFFKLKGDQTEGDKSVHQPNEARGALFKVASI